MFTLYTYNHDRRIARFIKMVQKTLQNTQRMIMNCHAAYIKISLLIVFYSTENRNLGSSDFTKIWIIFWRRAKFVIFKNEHYIKIFV